MAINFKDTDLETKTVLDNTNIWEVIYPVGTIYWTSNAADINSLLKVPKKISDKWLWQRIRGMPFSYDTDDEETKKYLEKANILDPVGGNYYSNPLKLNVENLPEHAHSIEHSHDIGILTIKGTTSTVNHWHGNPSSASGAFKAVHAYNYSGYRGSGTDEYWYNEFDASRGWQGELGSPTKKFSGYAGSDKGVYWLPPCTIAYGWRRIQ